MPLYVAAFWYMVLFEVWRDGSTRHWGRRCRRQPSDRGLAAALARRWAARDDPRRQLRRSVKICGGCRAWAGPLEDAHARPLACREAHGALDLLGGRSVLAVGGPATWCSRSRRWSSDSALEAAMEMGYHYAAPLTLFLAVAAVGALPRFWSTVRWRNRLIALSCRPQCAVSVHPGQRLWLSPPQQLYGLEP